MIDINKNNSVLGIHRCSKGDSIENCKKRIWVLDKLHGSYIIMFVGIFLTASLSTIVISAVANEINLEDSFLTEDMLNLARISESARLSRENLERLKNQSRKNEIAIENKKEGDNKFAEEKKKKVILCALYGAGYSEEAGKMMNQSKIKMSSKVKNQCSNLLIKPVESKQDLDVKWALYMIGNDARYLEMIIEPIKSLMRVDGIQNEDLEYISYITHNHNMDESMRLFDGILSKARSEGERESMKMGILSLWSFGSVVKSIPQLKKLVDEGKLQVENEDLKQQLKVAHYSSYCSKVLMNDKVIMFTAKKGAASGLKEAIKDNLYQDMKYYFKEGEEGELIIAQSAYSKNKMKPVNITIITPGLKRIKRQFFNSDEYQYENIDKARIIAEYIPINKGGYNIKGLYFIFYDQEGNDGSKKCTYFYQE